MLDVSTALKNPGSIFRFEEAIGFEPCTVMGEELTFSEAVLAGEYFGAGETISVRAELKVEVHAHCARCLAPVTLSMQVPCEAEFARTGDGEDIFPFTGHQIDVTPAAFEALLLELPMRFICSESCKGLCPSCGKNRNLGLCTCPEGVVNPNPFSALVDFVANQNNEEV